MARPHALASLLVALACACTTSFEADQLRARPDASLDADAARDAPPLDGADAAPDGAPTCGGENAACCEPTAAASPCVAGLVCSSGVCARCPGSLAACGGFCVDITSNASHCGRCGNACAAGYGCAAGSCALSCAAGLAACGAVCAQRLTDPAHCGSCGNACSFAHAAGACAAGLCAMGRCEAGYGDCDGNSANGCETRTASDVANCGGCAQACAPARARLSVCEGGACAVSTCEAGYGDCDRDASNGCEVNLLTNAAHCGACANACAGVGACAAGVCQSSSCAAGTADCAAATPGCETDVTSDLANCGACGNACALPNARSRCGAGACAVEACAAGYGDCDGMAATGCETDTRASLAHCGACGSVCALPNAATECAAGRCAVSACAEGFADCNGVTADGCEVDLRASPSNCGACASACAADNATAACASGRCAVGACVEGFADCDANPSNGCEADVRSSDSNCGACGVVCALPNAMAACQGRACALRACREGFANCDGDASNGCEVDLRADPAHCGACGSACAAANGMPGCVAGRCVVASCSAGFVDCDMGEANGCEVDVTSDARNCGVCGGACGVAQVCSSGACRAGCVAGLTVCGASCVDLRASAANCGACGRACPTRANASATCTNGGCGLACNVNFGNCDGEGTNGCETDLRTAVGHCGGCGRRCPMGGNSAAGCTMGACTLSCSFGWANCDGNPSNGCEVFPASDARNCSRCGRACSSINNTQPNCTLGLCVQSGACLPGYGNCDILGLNGCERSLLSDGNNCGACGRRCSGGQTCRGGTCG